MNTSLSKAVAIFGFAALALTAHAQDKGPKAMNSMSGMKTDCTKSMDSMKGIEGMKGMEGMTGMQGMKMDCIGKNSAKDASNMTSMSNGEVTAVDRVNKSITLKHGPIKSKTVDMGAMTMSFPVQKASLLTKVKVGNKVKFIVENVNDAATVTSLIVQK
jgi:Cu(I)/Ag(I) efflux system protein CusF